MKLKWNIKLARSLCTAFLAGTVMFASPGRSLYATDSSTETTTVETTTAETTVEEITSAETTTVDTSSIETTAVTNPLAETSSEETTAAAGENLVDPDVNKEYRYNITITFGQFSFYYDWGEWDVDHFVYKADASSGYPAASTMAENAGITAYSVPGWYGFDGTGNMISIINQSDSAEEDGIPVEVSFDSSVDEDGSAFPVQGVSMECYLFDRSAEASDWDMQAKDDEVQTLLESGGLVKLQSNNQTFSFDLPATNSKLETETAYIFVSFSGEPINTSDGLPFENTIPQRIGFITVTVGEPIKNTDIFIE